MSLLCQIFINASAIICNNFIFIREKVLMFLKISNVATFPFPFQYRVFMVSAFTIFQQLNHGHFLVISGLLQFPFIHFTYINRGIKSYTGFRSMLCFVVCLCAVSSSYVSHDALLYTHCSSCLYCDVYFADVNVFEAGSYIFFRSNMSTLETSSLTYIYISTLHVLIFSIAQISLGHPPLTL